MSRIIRDIIFLLLRRKIIVNGGTINIETPRSSFDANGTVELNGGLVTVNGEELTEISQEQMG